MSETLENGDKARRKGGVLAGYFVYICKGVADNNAPPLNALQFIIEAAGGQVLESLSKAGDPLKTIILTSEPCTNAQLTEKGVDQLADSGAKILSTAWLFHTMITQKFSSYIGNSKAQATKPRPASKRKASPHVPSERKRKSSRRKS